MNEAGLPSPFFFTGKGSGGALRGSNEPPELAGAIVGAVADRACFGRYDRGSTRRFAPDAVGARVYNGAAME